MPNVTIYTKDYCPYCIKAKNLLKRKGVENISEIDITKDEATLQEMLTRSGGRKTVPQIFIGDKHIGGFDDLAALDSAGDLTLLLEK